MEENVFVDQRGTGYRAKYIEGVNMDVTQEAAVYTIRSTDGGAPIPILLDSTVRILLLQVSPSPSNFKNHVQSNPLEPQ